MRHRKTWLLWINQLSPISPMVSNVSLGDREALADALAFASPGGPVGIKCVDPCNCHGEVEKDLLELYSALNEKLTIADPHAFLARAREAITVDLISPKQPFPAKQLTEIDVAISLRNAHVAHARFQFPRTWSVVHDEATHR